MKFRKTIATLSAAALFSSVAITANAKEYQLTDVSTEADYYHTVKKLVEFDIISGYSDNTFKPGNLVTRGQAASMLAKLLGVDLSDVKDPGYSDVTIDNSHYVTIAKLTELGFFDEVGEFKPNDILTRAQLAELFVKAFEFESDTFKTFNDVSKDDEYYKYIGILGSLDITRVGEDYRPNEGVKRANFAVFIERAINFKRSDNKQDIFDTWGTWDNKGVINPPKETDEDKEEDPKTDDNNQPTNETEKLRFQLLETEIEVALDDFEDAEEEIDKILENLKKAEKAKDEGDIEDEKENLSDALKELEDLIDDAEDVLKRAREANFADLDKDEENLDKAIDNAKELISDNLSKSYSEDYFEDKLDEAIDELEDKIKDAERALKSDSLIGLNSNYMSLQTEIEDAEETLESYEDSDVESLEDEAEDLENVIDEAEDLIKKLEDTIEDKFDSQVKYFKKLIDDILDDLEEAIDDEDKSEIYDAQEDLEEVIENAEKLLKDYKDVEIKSVENDKSTLEDTIERAEKALAESKK